MLDALNCFVYAKKLFWPLEASIILYGPFLFCSVCSVYYRLVLKLSHLKLLYPTELGLLQGSPAELVTDYEKNEDFLCKIHRVLLEVKVLEGCLQCPESGCEFPNMLLNEDEA
ncbi:multifunctional methyltransferase subunit TRM112-like protein [Oncorhynchus mykiss]|uniref:Multifunctional methyltransferase subunit TRM112-like protein n=1 Tax=Oncorhynchus mykiss TaxID=8022 RepID=A0A8C7QZV9_ONCMY|nr:multifunctional methyltransferase subunit TRM112-like protein [Oncorhynchus mykiss]